MPVRIAIIIAPLLLFHSIAAPAALYKWVDEYGNVHYSDKNPAENTGSIQTIEKSRSSRTLTAPEKLEAITKPPKFSSEYLFLEEVRYIWDRPAAAVRPIRVGVYHIGEGCTSRGAIRMPQSPSRQSRLFPERRIMTNYAFSLIQKLNYPATIITKVWDARSRRIAEAEGLILSAEVVRSDYDVCAPKVKSIQKYGTPEKIPYWDFTKHRLQLEVRWRLRQGVEGAVLFDATSVGNFSNWQTDPASSGKGQLAGWKADNPPTKAFTEAMTRATMALFADPEFLQQIVSE